MDEHREKYEKVKGELAGLGFILKGSVTERWVQCGKAACACHTDPKARHGPYYQWSWKTSGRTRSKYLSAEQAAMCREWVANLRRAEEILRRMEQISQRAAAACEIRSK